MPVRTSGYIASNDMMINSDFGRMWTKGVQPFYGKVSYSLLQGGSRDARGKVTISDIPNRLHYLRYLYYIHNLCGHEVYNATWQGTGWRPMMWTQAVLA